MISFQETVRRLRRRLDRLVGRQDTREIENELAFYKKRCSDACVEIKSMIPVCELWHKVESEYPFIAELVKKEPPNYWR